MSFIIIYVLLISISLVYTTEERRIVLIGKLGAGKSHTGNGILGKDYFKSKGSFVTVTRECGYRSAIRNGLLYKVFDTPGINSPDDMHKRMNENTDIARCLYCTFPGFHAIVLVISGEERISNEDLKMLKTLDDLLGESAFTYMIIVVSKVENEEVLNRMISESPDMADLKFKCKNRVVSFGYQKGTIPLEFVRNFDYILTELIKENARQKKPYYTHKFYDRAMRILEKDKADYIKNHPEVSEEEALKNVRIEAAEGYSPREQELRNLTNDGYCIIL